MNTTNSFFKENKIGIIIAIIFIVVGTTYYFGAGLGKMGPDENTVAVLKTAQIKVAVADGKVIKLFATASPNALAKLSASKGVSIPEGNGLVVGYDEAKMMTDEKLFSKPGDSINGLFGIDVTIGGVLAKTGDKVDMMHFVSESQYQKLQGEENRAFVKIDEEGSPELWLVLKEDEKPIVPFEFRQGSISDYKPREILGVTYYPIILGAEEGRMMQEGGDFKKIGDTLDVYGKKVFVVGVLAKTGTALDMMHITEFSADDLA